MARRFSVEAVFKGVDRVTAPVSRMQQRMQRFTRSMRRGLQSVNRVTAKVSAGLRKGAAVAAIAAAGLGMALNSVADEADALAKQSRRLDFDIQALQEWRFVAEQSGVSTQQLDSALGAFTKRLGEAAGDTGPLVSGLKKINPELLEQVKNAGSVSSAFELYVDAMRNTESATERAALANAAFSRSGLNLANISDNGTAAVNAMRREMRENGIVTMEQAEAAEVYNDAVNSLKRAWRGFMTGVLVPLMPMLTDLAKSAREWMVANRELSASAVQDWVKKLVDNLAEVFTWFKRLATGIAVFYAFSAALQVLLGVITLVNLAMAANPVTLVVLGIMALIAVIALAVYYWDEILAAITRFAVMGAAKVGEFVEWVGSKFEGMLSFFRSLGADISTTWQVVWSGVSDFFSDTWDGIVDNMRSKIDWILSAVERVKRAARGVGRFFGLGDDEETVDSAEQRARSTGDGESLMSSPQERTARSIEERRSTADLTIRDETGRAEFRQRGESPGIGFSVVPTGSFAQ